MGEAIARFREAALSIRRLCDERLSEPTWAVAEPAAKTFCSRCRRLMSEFEAGHLGAEGYIRRLRQEKKTAERQPGQDEQGQRRFALVEWLPASMRPAAVPKMQPLAVEAAQEALHWGPHFPLIESHIRALSAATARLQERLGYAAHLSRWQAAFDALAPFVTEPPKPVSPTSEKQTGGSRGRGGRNRKGIGGRPEMYPATLVRKVVAAREKYEKNQKRLKQRILPRSQWLFDYCGDEGIDTRSTFPSKDPQHPEDWDVRSNRFWRAAKKRLRESRN